MLADNSLCNVCSVGMNIRFELKLLAIRFESVCRTGTMVEVWTVRYSIKGRRAAFD